jgi:hypothetical protein
MSENLLTAFDDYPIHQAPRPIATQVTSDRNAYGRYWLGAGHRNGDFHVELAFGRYPNLRVVDGHLSIVKDGRQSSFHASGEAPLDPTDTHVGPFRLEVVEPLKELRFIIEPNETGISADLTYRARTGALLEDHTVMIDGPTVMVDMARFLQFGSWEGTVDVDGDVTVLRHEEVFGIRDRSWGVRPVGTQPAGRPASRTPMAWLWAPIHFDDDCRVVGWFELPGGTKWRADGHVIPVNSPVPLSVAMGDDGVSRIEPEQIHFEFHKGSRWARSIAIDVTAVAADGTDSSYTMDLEPMLRFDMLGIGYQHPTWSHGVWHGVAEVGRDDWNIADVVPLDPSHQHVHHVVKATMRPANGVPGETKVGVGIFEQIMFGPHTQWGFSEILDGSK